MALFHLEILSPGRAFYVGDCRSLILPISDGMMGIMANHEPMTAAIPEGEVTFELPDGERRVCAVTLGMADVSGNRVKLLCESVLRPDEIDEEHERRRAEEAMAEMRKKQSHKDFMLSQIAFAKAVNNLRVKQHNAMKVNHL